MKQRNENEKLKMEMVLQNDTGSGAFDKWRCAPPDPWTTGPAAGRDGG